MGKLYQVVVNGYKGDKMMIDLCNTEEQMKSMTVLQLKEKISAKVPESTGPETFRLIFTDKHLDENSALLSAYGVQHMSVIHMVMRVPGGSGPWWFRSLVVQVPGGSGPWWFRSPLLLLLLLTLNLKDSSLFTKALI